MTINSASTIMTAVSISNSTQLCLPDLTGLQTQRQTESETGISESYGIIKNLNGPGIIVLVTDGGNNRIPKGINIMDMVKGSVVKFVTVGIIRRLYVYLDDEGVCSVVAVKITEWR